MISGRNGWEYDPEFWDELDDGDFNPKPDRFNEDGTVNRDWNKPQEGEPQEEEEEDTQEDEKPKSSGSSYKQLMQRFTQIFLDEVLKEFKKNAKFESPFGKKW